MIRPATLADIPAMVALGRAMHAESPLWSRLAYSGEKVGALIERLIDFDDGFAWVAIKDGQVVGAFLLTAHEHWISEDRIVGELALFVEPSARGALLAGRLITAGVAWAEERGARFFFAGSSTGVEPERTAQFYERFGFARTPTIAVERVM